MRVSNLFKKEKLLNINENITKQNNKITDFIRSSETISPRIQVNNVEKEENKDEIEEYID